MPIDMHAVWSQHLGMAAARRLLRTVKGKDFSEGARRLWLALERKRLSQLDAGSLLGTDGATVCRWLYGERRPSLEFAFKIEKLFRIDAKLWLDEPTEAFEFPGARPAA
jgi:transcriptional regulator with XRE-family HTH domain